jgi:hypothetical protein
MPVRMKRTRVQRFGVADEYLSARGQPRTMRNRVLVRDFADRYRAQARNGRDLFSWLDSNLGRALGASRNGGVQA